MKQCRRCGAVKENVEFREERRNTDGLRSHCRQCGNAQRVEYYWKNREKELMRNAQFKIENPDYWKHWNKPYAIHKKATCEICGFVPEDSCQLAVDHIDGNHHNNDIKNLQTLCHNCHILKTKKNKDTCRRYA